MNKKYTIGHISIDSNGDWWVDWLGTHVQQGGPCFSPGNMGMKDIKSLLKIVSKDMENCKELYLGEIRAKND